MDDRDNDTVEGESRNLPVLTFRDRAQIHAGHVFVETGRGNAVEVNIGADVESTLDNIADQCNYGGDYRVFLNANEILDPNEIPTDEHGNKAFQAGQRWSLTAYDKPGC